MKITIRLIVINVLVLASLWLTAEIVFGILLHFRPLREPTYYKSFDASSSSVDDYIGYQALPGKTVYALKIYDKDTVFNTWYRTDSLGCRVNPNNKAGRKNHALFFGCSCTFGEGVADTQTSAYYFSLADSSYNTFNYAFGGYGTHQMTAFFEKEKLPQVPAGGNVFAVYFYLDGHLNRNIGSMSVVNGWGANTPYYIMEEGKPVHKGLFSRDREFLNRFYWLAGKSRVLRYLQADLPLFISRRHYELTAALIESSFENYVRQYGNTNFFVVNFPGSSNKLFEYIHNPDIKKLDYSALVDLQKHSIRNEGHPDAYCYQVIASQLNKDIKKYIP